MQTIAGCILCNQNGDYLLVQERQEKVRGKWNIPAGYAENGEADNIAATRETQEEVGLEIVTEAEPLYVHENAEKQKRYVAFRGRIVGGQLAPQEEEILSVEWLSFEMITALHQQGMIRDSWIFNALKKAHHENFGD